MKKITAIFVALVFIAAGLSAQAPPPAGTKRPWTNVVGAEWPRVDAQLRVHFRVSAPKAQIVTVSIGPTTLAKGEDGFWTGITPPQNPGFHIYRLTIDGVESNDTASEAFWDAGGIYSGIDIIEEGLDHYDVKNVPHGEVRSLWYFASAVHQHGFEGRPGSRPQHARTARQGRREARLLRSAGDGARVRNLAQEPPRVRHPVVPEVMKFEKQRDAVIARRR